VIDPDTKQPLIGQYAAGWIKRGPSGVIGTNKPDSVETVQAMLADAEKGQALTPAQPEPDCIEKLVRERQPRFVTYADWLKLDELELERGKAAGRPRVKFTTVDEMLKALGK
jgi:ferredoxin--NADP+ reductase